MSDHRRIRQLFVANLSPQRKVAMTPKPISGRPGASSPEERWRNVPRYWVKIKDPVKDGRVPQGEAQVDEHVATVASEDQRQAHEEQDQAQERPEEPEMNEDRHVDRLGALAWRDRSSSPAGRGSWRNWYQLRLAGHRLKGQAGPAGNTYPGRSPSFDPAGLGPPDLEAQA